MLKRVVGAPRPRSDPADRSIHPCGGVRHRLSHGVQTMTLIELVRSIDGAEEALAWEGLECNRRWETGWKWSRRPISEGMARTVIHGLAGNLRADRACPGPAAFDPTPRAD